MNPVNYVSRLKTEEGEPAIHSHWLPTSEELELLNKGRPVQILMIGPCAPKLAIWVGDPK